MRYPALIAILLTLLSRSAPAQEPPAIVGSWAATLAKVEVTIAFDAEGRYAIHAKGPDGEVRLDGFYELAEGKLTLSPSNGPVTTYDCVIEGGKLTLSGGDLKTPAVFAQTAGAVEPPPAEPAVPEPPVAPEVPPAPSADRSTPEKAIESFFAFLDSLGADPEFWRSVEAEAMAATDALCTKGSLEKARAKREEKSAAEPYITTVPGGLFEIAAVTPAGDQVLVTGHRPITVRTKVIGGEGYSESQVKEPYAFTFTKAGEEWLLARLTIACTSCSGSGACQKCNGAGLFKGSTCPRCNGAKTCSRCGGKGLIDATLTHSMLLPGTLTLFVADEPQKLSTDRSTPRAAAAAVMDSWTAREVITTRRALEWLAPKMAAFCALLTPANAEAARKGLEMEIEAGRQRLAGVERGIESDREGDGVAVVMTVVKVAGLENRAVLKFVSTERGWALSATLTARCVYCAGKGVCPLCNGTGQSAGAACLTCEGKGICAQCAGLGWIE